MLKAEWFSAAATVCASPDTSISRVWNAGDHSDPAPDQEQVRRDGPGGVDGQHEER